MLQLKPRDTWILRFHDSEFDYFAADQINGAHALLKVLRQSHPTWDESAILRRELEQNKDLLPTLSLQPMGFLHQDNHAVLVWPERNQEPLFHRIPGYGMEV
ncbi:MAG: hypothetical protein KDC71_05305 [Acidobacteria bacterium]|nr:hypothetical protein [Acidobacteriota bacterium]